MDGRQWVQRDSGAALHDMGPRCGLGAALVLLLALGALALNAWEHQTGLGVRGGSFLQQTGSEEQPADGGVARVRSIAREASGEVLLGVLGGFRTVVADFVFLRSYIAWANKKRGEAEALIRLSVLIDPGPEIFWKTGAHTLAFDMPVWRMQEAGGVERTPPSVERRIRLEHMEMAVRFLEEGAALDPRNPMFPIEMGKIVLNASQDFARTAALFEHAWRMDAAPPFIGRLLSRVLESMGEIERALEMLRYDLERYSPDDPRAFYPLIEQRVAELEALLAESVQEPQ